MRQIEDRFNHQFHYPWVFLNDEPFTQEFRLLTAGMASGDVEYGLIDNEKEWSTPEWIDTEKAQEAMAEMVRQDVIYGGSVSYRCLPIPLLANCVQTYVSLQLWLLLPSPPPPQIRLVLARRTRHRLLLFHAQRPLHFYA